jgi:hypothetical protein
MMAVPHGHRSGVVRRWTKVMIAVLFIFAVVEAVLVVAFVRSLLEYAQSPTGDEAVLDQEQGVSSIPTLPPLPTTSGPLAAAQQWQVHPS